MSSLLRWTENLCNSALGLKFEQGKVEEAAKSVGPLALVSGVVKHGRGQGTGSVFQLQMFRLTCVIAFLKMACMRAMWFYATAWPAAVNVEKLQSFD